MTLGDYLDEWAKGLADVRASTSDHYRQHVRDYLIPALGDVPLARLSAAMVKAFVAELPAMGKRRELSPATVRRVHATLHRALGDAVDDGLIGSNPAALRRGRRSGLPMIEHREVKPWTIEELRTFLDAIQGHEDFALYWLAASTGARRGELLGLEWSDLNGSTLAIRRSLTPEGAITATKTGRARTVELDPETVRVMREHQRRTGRIAGPMFTDAVGHHLDPRRVSKDFPALAKAAGLRPTRFHDLRHLHATVLANSGLPVKVVAERLGHSTPTTTLAIYSHAFSESHSAAAGVIASLLREAR
jgi:integrase